MIISAVAFIIVLTYILTLKNLRICIFSDMDVSEVSNFIDFLCNLYPVVPRTANGYQSKNDLMDLMDLMEFIDSIWTPAAATVKDRERPRKTIINFEEENLILMKPNEFAI